MLSIREKASEFRKWGERIVQSYDFQDDNIDTMDLTASMREEYNDEMEGFVWALSAGATSFASYDFPAGFFDNWDWV